MAPEQIIRDALARWTLEHHLTAAEAAILEVAVLRDACHATIAAERGVAPDTVKKQAAGIVTKTRTRSLSHAALCLLREVVGELTSERPDPSPDRALAPCLAEPCRGTPSKAQPPPAEPLLSSDQCVA